MRQNPPKANRHASGSPPAKSHRYHVDLTWTGNRGDGTAHYRAYERAYQVAASGKPTILGSADPTFRGDAGRWNPEELLLSSVASCHMLWFLHLAANQGLKVLDYQDSSQATMTEDGDGGGRFTVICLYPQVQLAQPDSDEQRQHQQALVESLHDEANRLCFVANSLSLPVHHQASVIFKPVPPSSQSDSNLA